MVTVNREKSTGTEIFREIVADLTLQGTTKGLSPFQFLSMAKYSLSPYRPRVTGWGAILCALIWGGGGFRHLFTFFCVSTLPHHVRNVIRICAHPIHSEEQKCTNPFLWRQRYCDLSGPSMHNFTVKEEHKISHTSPNLPLPISDVQNMYGRFS